MKPTRQTLSCALRFAQNLRTCVVHRFVPGLVFRFVAALLAFGTVDSVRGQGMPPDEIGPPGAVVVGGFVVSQDFAIDWAAYPNATLGLVGDLESTDTATVILLPLDHRTMTVDDWLEIGVDLTSASLLIASLLPEQSLAAVLNIDGQVQSVIVTSPAASSPFSSSVVVSAPPNTPPMTIEEWVALLIRLLEEYKRHLNPGNDPSGAW